MSLLLTIIGISVLIILHEAGHYLVARLCKMRVLKFSLGFGPRLWERRIGETTWQVAAILVGGYVQIHGMGPTDERLPAEDDRSFRNRPTWQRALVIFAGPASNWLLAAFFVALLAFTVGFEIFDQHSPTIGRVLEDSPAAAAGLEPGDRITRAAEQPISDWPGLVAAIRQVPDQTVTLELERDGQPLTIEITPRSSEQGDYGEIGVTPSSQIVRLGFFGAIATGFRGAWLITSQQVELLWGFVTGTKEGKLSGLPGIVKMVSAQAQQGMGYLLDALARLSITLFLLNLLPIPALDGSRLVFLGVEAVRRRPVDQRVEAMVHGVGFLLLLALIIFVSVRDLF